MRNFAALTRRELGVYFVSPMAYIILTAVLFISGLVFITSMAGFASVRLPADFKMTLNALMFVVVLTSALVTMRLLAEEKSRGTLEIVMTAPVTELEFVLSKFAAAMVLLAFLLLPTLGHVFIISRYGQVDPGALFCGYMGVLLVGAVTYSIGLFVSALCSSQITAGVISFALSILLVLCLVLSQGMEETSPWKAFLAHVDLTVNFGDFLKGVLDRGRMTYLLSVVAFFLFLTVRVVESRRWR